MGGGEMDPFGRQGRQGRGDPRERLLDREHQPGPRHQSAVNVPERPPALWRRRMSVMRHAAIDRLAHVVDRQRGGADRAQRLHLDPGPAADAAGRGDLDRGRVGRAGQLDLDRGQRQRMAERDQLGRALGAHDAGELRDRQHVALPDPAAARSARASPACISTRPDATATRSVTGLALTSTITALPAASKWLSSLMPRTVAAEQRRGRRAAHRPGASAPRPPGSSARRPPPAARGRGGVSSPLSATTQAVRRHPRRQLARSSQDRPASVLRLRLLMPISRVSSRERPLELGGIVDLDQHVHAAARGERSPARPPRRRRARP